MHWKSITVVVLFGLMAACSKDPGASPNRLADEAYNPELRPVDFPSGNQWSNSLMFGGQHLTYIYEGITNEGFEHIELRKSDQPVLIQDIPCGVLTEEVWIDGRLIERTTEYCAEDKDRVIWLLGTSVENFNEAGTLINRFGSWRYGEGNAKPGIKLPAIPQPGMTYREEYLFNVAENQAEVISNDVYVETAMGSHTGCVLIREWSELEPGLEEYNIYAPGIGFVKEYISDPGYGVELVDIR